MLKKEKLIGGTISFDEQLYVDRVRKFLGDFAASNKLDAVQESDDQDIYDAMIDTLDEINFEYLPTSNYTFETVPSFNLLKLGATLQILTSKGILSSRNTLTYTDSGGVTVQDMDKYGRYINYFNVLIAKYQRGVQNMKVGQNVDDAWGGVHSEYWYTREGA